MSNRTERRAAEHAARKLANKLSRQQSLAAAAPHQFAAVEPAVNPSETIAESEADYLDRTATATSTTSAAQIQANRANAQHSSGPVSAAGKAVASRNNTRHGLTAETEAENFRVLGNESQSDYDNNLTAFRTEWKPETATEHDLVNRLVMHQWLRRRALRLQDTLFSAETGDITDFKKFELYRRYETSHERGFNKTFADLMRLRSFQLRQQNGFESQQRKNQEHEFKMQRLKNQEELQKTARDTKIARQNSEPLSKAA